MQDLQNAKFVPIYPLKEWCQVLGRKYRNSEKSSYKASGKVYSS